MFTARQNHYTLVLASDVGIVQCLLVVKAASGTFYLSHAAPGLASGCMKTDNEPLNIRLAAGCGGQLRIAWLSILDHAECLSGRIRVLVTRKRSQDKDGRKDEVIEHFYTTLTGKLAISLVLVCSSVRSISKLTWSICHSLHNAYLKEAFSEL